LQPIIAVTANGVPHTVAGKISVPAAVCDISVILVVALWRHRWAVSAIIFEAAGRKPSPVAAVVPSVAVRSSGRVVTPEAIYDLVTIWLILAFWRTVVNPV